MRARLASALALLVVTTACQSARSTRNTTIAPQSAADSATASGMDEGSPETELPPDVPAAPEVTAEAIRLFGDSAAAAE